MGIMAVKTKKRKKTKNESEKKWKKSHHFFSFQFFNVIQLRGWKGFIAEKQIQKRKTKENDCLELQQQQQKQKKNVLNHFQGNGYSILNYSKSRSNL